MSGLVDSLRSGEPLPRPLLLLGAPVAGVLLVLFFVYLGFPYAVLKQGLAVQLSRATGAQVEISDLEPALSLLGPGLAAEGVSATLADGTQVAVERVVLRPAWSLSWLGGDPAVALDARGDFGRVDGTLVTGDEPGFDGQLEDVQLARLPVQLPLELALDGRTSGDLDLRLTGAGPTGSVHLEAVDGSVAPPGMPLALPFATLDVDVELGSDPRADVRRLVLDGPMLAVEATGKVGAAPSLDRAPLDLALKLEVREPSVRPMIESTGVHLGRDGRADVRVVGTVGHPLVR